MDYVVSSTITSIFNTPLHIVLCLFTNILRSWSNILRMHLDGIWERNFKSIITISIQLVLMEEFRDGFQSVGSFSNFLSH